MDKAKPTAVTVGTFDGVHRGHLEVLGTLKSEAAARGLRPTVVTFDRHPLEIVAPDRAPGLIMDPDMRDATLRSEGVDVRRIEFTDNVRRMTAAEWMRVLHDRFSARLVVLGYDNTFGSDGRSISAADYAGLGKKLGIEVLTAPAIAGCSSSEIRRAVENGDMERAAQILCRPFSLSGTVARGRQVGRTIGVPTANLSVSPHRLLPATGVYAGIAITADGRRLPAVVNVGRCPTVTDGHRLTVEAHILDFSGNLYGQPLTVEFHRKLRDERKFPDLDSLRRQIESDMSEARRVESAI